jgi:general secretion pathway protein B
MSFILDALRKSETDRQEQSVAEFSGVPTSPQTRTLPRWLWIVGLLLAINLVVLIGLVVKPGPVTTQQPLPVTERAVDPAATPASIDLPQPSFAERAATARQSPPEQQQIAVVEAKESTQDFVRPVLISQDPASVPARDLYPTLQEVRVSGSINVPELHLDIHVFSQDPDDRFVFINMTKLREGSALAEGPVVAEITPHGVVLRHEGQNFLLPRE